MDLGTPYQGACFGGSTISMVRSSEDPGAKQVHEDETQKRGAVPEIASVYSRMRRLRVERVARVEADVLEHLASELRSKLRV